MILLEFLWRIHLNLSVRLSGPVGISVDATDLFMGADVALLIATVLLVLILLLLIYRSPILALIPLIGVGFAYAVTSPLLGLDGGRRMDYSGFASHFDYDRAFVRGRYGLLLVLYFALPPRTAA